MADERFKRFCAAVVQSICDFDDRTSPEDQPDMLLVTGEELVGVMENHMRLLGATPDLLAQQAERERELVGAVKAELHAEFGHLLSFQSVGGPCCLSRSLEAVDRALSRAGATP